MRVIDVRAATNRYPAALLVLFALVAVSAFAQSAPLERGPGPLSRPGKPALAQEDLKNLPQTPKATGDQQRHYFFPEANVEWPYRLYVPKSWDGKKKLPLVVVLHGHGGNHDSPFDNPPADLKGILQQQAEKHSFIVVSPEGYGRADWGNTLPLPYRQKFQGERQSPDEEQRDNELSEKDVLNVIQIVSKEYGTDPRQLYLMGNSGGSMGTLSLAAKFPAMWAAISPSDGPVEPSLYPFPKLKGIAGARVLHGENDTMASMEAMKETADGIKEQGVDATFIVVPGAGHGTAWYVALPETFDFFDKHRIEPATPGDHRLIYAVEGKQIPYRLFVPSGWLPAKSVPLVVLFPGGSSDENALYDKAPEELRDVVRRQAELHGFVVLSLNAAGGNFGAKFTLPAGMAPLPHAPSSVPLASPASSTLPPPDDASANKFSEQVSLAIIEKVVADYRLDTRRIYLTGNSRGEVATMHFAEAFPGKWCAIAPTSGPFVDPDFRWENLRSLSGAIFFHGEKDTQALMAPNREIAEKVRAVGVPTQFKVVSGAMHNTTWFTALPEIFNFFDSNKCGR